MKHLVLILVLIGCTHLREHEELIAGWIGRDIHELERHPLFSQFRVKKVKKDDGSVLVTYADGAPILTKAAAQGLGGSAGPYEYWCEHLFTTRNDDKIVHYEQLGPCPYNPNLIPIEDQNK